MKSIRYTRAYTLHIQLKSKKQKKKIKVGEKETDFLNQMNIHLFVRVLFKIYPKE